MKNRLYICNNAKNYNCWDGKKDEDTLEIINCGHGIPHEKNCGCEVPTCQDGSKEPIKVKCVEYMPDFIKEKDFKI